MIPVVGIDHLYLTVSDLARSEAFYDIVLVDTLGFRKAEPFRLGADLHASYYNHLFGVVLRPARVIAAHDPYSPGLHHFCWRVETPEDVVEVARQLRARGIAASPATCYPEYAEDYVATFFDDPDGIRLEVTNYRAERRERLARWQDEAGGAAPCERGGRR